MNSGFPLAELPEGRIELDVGRQCKATFAFDAGKNVVVRVSLMTNNHALDPAHLERHVGKARLRAAMTQATRYFKEHDEVRSAA